MPRVDGYELMRQVRQRPEFRLLPVILLTEFGNTKQRIRGYQTGCDLYLPKPFEMEELGAIIRNLLERSQIVQSEWQFSQGKPPVSPATPENGHHHVDNGHFPSLQEDLDLSEREQQVLEWLTKGLSNVEIGQKLHLSPRTIEKYVSSLLRKTDTSNRAELVRFALDHKLVV
jgi:DNA-binding NarL/FixJ family response regulator